MQFRLRGWGFSNETRHGLQSTFPPLTITPTRWPRAMILPSTARRPRAHRRLDHDLHALPQVEHAAQQFFVAHRPHVVHVVQNQRKLSLPAECVRAPSAMVSGLCTLCSVGLERARQSCLPPLDADHSDARPTDIRAIAQPESSPPPPQGTADNRGTTILDQFFAAVALPRDDCG